ncbi:MAG: DinB family protein [Treponemataceae bacterium]|nr:MAG: DinB family protein [Treponemataceae bacterium]
MKETCAMFANYNKEANQTILALLDKLSNDEREKERGSYYGSLSGLFRHVMGGTKFFLSLYKEALSENPAALNIIGNALSAEIPEGKLSETQWRGLAASLSKLDNALTGLIGTLGEGELRLPVKWFTGSPAEVPLSFMLHQLAAHNTHHRGQISQILDELKIDNNYSGINVSFVPANE